MRPIGFAVAAALVFCAPNGAHASDTAPVAAFKSALLSCKAQVLLTGPLTGLEQHGFQREQSGFRWSSGGDAVSAVATSYTCTVIAEGPAFGNATLDQLLATWAADNRLVRDESENVWNGVGVTMAGGVNNGRIRVVFA